MFLEGAHASSQDTYFQRRTTIIYEIFEKSVNRDDISMVRFLQSIWAKLVKNYQELGGRYKKKKQGKNVPSQNLILFWIHNST